MNSLLRDISAAKAGTEKQESRQNPSLIEQMTLNPDKKQTETDTSQERRAPTEEEQKQMLDFLVNLEKLKTTNPDEFNKIMESITGVSSSTNGAGSGTDQTSLDGLVQAVRNLRSQGDDSTNVGNINMLGKKKDMPAGIKILPEPGFTFKTRLANSKDEASKIFVNICINDKIAVPGIKKRLNADGVEEEGLNIPMSVGAGRGGSDKSGVSCTIYDIVVNPEVMGECESDKSGKYRDFVCQLGMQCIEQKYGLVLDRRYKLPKLKYMGEPEAQWIQDRSKAPVIEEVAPNSETAKKVAAKKLAMEREAANALAVETARLEKDLSYTATFKNATTNSLDIDSSSAANGSEVLALPQCEYQEPIYVPDSKYQSIVVCADIESYEIDISNVVIQASPFVLVIKVPTFKSQTLHLPCAIDVSAVSCMLKRRDGYAGVIDLIVELPLDRSDWGAEADPGSKSWLLSRALNSEVESDSYNPYVLSIVSGESESLNGEPLLNRVRANEDPFHLRAPVLTSTATMVQQDEGDLPEDRFHKKDASSQYYVQLRDQGVQEKWDRHKAEKEEREKNPDPNVEYIDVDDFKPGGKMGPKSEVAELAIRLKEEVEEERRKAVDVLTALAPQTISTPGLSSNWAELL